MASKPSLAIVLVISFGFQTARAGDKTPQDFTPQPPVPALSPEESLKHFQLPEGYALELVLSEPDIKEPVVCVFDGNGRMFVAEMRTYMQEIDGKNQHTPGGRVSMHESSRGDGNFDKHSVFADKLVLPRMVLPLDERVLINVTDTNDIHTYRDTNGDGVSDAKEIFYEGGARGGNLEHQPSGLVWCMDNWLYTAGNNYRLRVKDGKALKESTNSNGGQWGLAQDDHGKPWFSTGGGERGLIRFQTHIHYGSIDLPDQIPPGFLEVFPLVPIPDVQGGTGRFRTAEKTLNHMTASCGQEIVRGDRLPQDLRGDALIGEPVGRLIRRCKIEVKDGITYLRNPHEKSEFIRSTDPNFRPVNMVNGPDGCLYIVDMYRGIIQEGNWVREGSYLRKVVRQYSLDKNFGRGRIWRLSHKDFKPGPQPRMLDEKPSQLVAHLEHPNGWWRDTAQKLLVLRGDHSVVPALAQMARAHANYLSRLHALWTLEGLGAVDKELLREKFKDAHPQLRIAAIRISESLFKNNDKSLLADAQALCQDPDPHVVLQTIMSAKAVKAPELQSAAEAALQASSSRGVKEIGKIVLMGPAKQEKKDQYNAAELKLLRRGDEIYKELCFGCHGIDGKGAPMQGAPAGVTLAPPLSGSKTLRHKDAPIHILLNGLNGPVEGKTYGALMVPMNSNSDEWIASAASYVRNNFGNSGSFVTPEDVARVRASTKGRAEPWTLAELRALLPQPLDSKKWKLTASHNPAAAGLAIDNKLETRYDTHTPQIPGMWFQIELPDETEVAGLRLNCAKSGADYPRGYKVELSSDGKTWGKPAATGKGATPITEIDFTPVKARFIRITQTGSVGGLFWSIHEMEILGSGTSAGNPGVEKKKG